MYIILLYFYNSSGIFGKLSLVITNYFGNTINTPNIRAFLRKIIKSVVQNFEYYPPDDFYGHTNVNVCILYTYIR